MKDYSKIAETWIKEILKILNIAREKWHIMFKVSVMQLTKGFLPQSTEAGIQAKTLLKYWKTKKKKINKCQVRIINLAKISFKIKWNKVIFDVV